MGDGRSQPGGYEFFEGIAATTLDDRYLLEGMRHTGDERETWFAIVGPSGANLWDDGVPNEERASNIQSVGGGEYVMSTSRGAATQYSVVFDRIELEPTPAPSSNPLEEWPRYSLRPSNATSTRSA